MTRNVLHFKFKKNLPFQIVYRTTKQTQLSSPNNKTSRNSSLIFSYFRAIHKTRPVSLSFSQYIRIPNKRIRVGLKQQLLTYLI